MQTRGQILSLLALAAVCQGAPSTLHAARSLRQEVPQKPEASAAALPSRPTVALGFTGAPLLRQAISQLLSRAGGYRLVTPARAPAVPSLTGELLQLRERRGWMQCRARYSLARPSVKARQAGIAAARVPILPAHDAAEGRQARSIAEEGCLAEVAVQLAALLPAPGPRQGEERAESVVSLPPPPAFP